MLENTLLLFGGVFFFYFLCKKQTDKKWIGLQL